MPILDLAHSISLSSGVERSRNGNLRYRAGPMDRCFHMRRILQSRAIYPD